METVLREKIPWIAKIIVSQLSACLQPGQSVTTSRYDVDYVATEFGIAALRGKTLRQRCEALIEIAHPDFRDQPRDDCSKLNGGGH